MTGTATLPAMDIPHDRIRATVDWSWTAVLLEQLPRAADDDERADIADTLVQLGDPRSAGPLRALVLDASTPTPVRESASLVLRNDLVDEPGDAALRGWWASPDPVLRAHALRSMGPAQADIVVAVADDATHPLHVDAIGKMAFGFDRPAHHRLVIDALAHADPAVRAMAASTLVWDEPAAAEVALVAALDDPSALVASEAADTLTCYRTRTVLRALATRRWPLVDGPRDPDGLARDFVDEVRRLPAAAQLALRPWLAPIDDLLAAAWAEAASEAELDVEAAPTAAPPLEVVASAAEVDDLLAGLAVVDGPRTAIRSRVRRLSPLRIAPTDRGRLLDATLGHVDPDVRHTAVVWCGHWGLGARLSALLTDADDHERRAAAWALSLVPPDPALAPVLCAHLHRSGVRGTHAAETLKSYTVHADRDSAIATLVAAANEDVRESVVHAAIGALDELDAGEALARLMPGLGAPPRVTWVCHVALLGAARRLGLAAPAAAAIADVDQLDVQVALATLRSGRGSGS
jgi:hypothetical protein